MTLKLCPYLSFDGQCEAALKFYEQCLDGQIESMMFYKGSPMAKQVPADWGNKVMHSELRLGDRVLMAADCPPEQYEPAKGTNLMVDIEDSTQAEKAFSALANKGTVTMPIQETFWATKFGMLIDQFGIPWMINCGQK